MGSGVHLDSLCFRARLPLLLLLVLATSGCAATGEYGEVRPENVAEPALKHIAQTTNDCPPASTLPNKTGWELGAANYTARQEGETVTVTATGETPTAGFKVQLAREPMKIFPPKFAVYRKPPDGFAAQVITPFTVCIAFKSRQPVSAVSVRDSRGEHRVKVESLR